MSKEGSWFPELALEADLLKFTRELLDILQNLGLLVYTRIHVMPIIRRRRPLQLSKNDDMRGFSDLEIIVPGGRVGYLELKSKDGILSEDQETFLTSRARMGCHTAHARTQSDVINFIKILGVDVDGVLKGFAP